MLQTLLIAQIFIVLLLIGVILLQRTSNDGFTSMAGGLGSALARRSGGNFLVKMTMVLIIAFMVNSILLARLVVKESGETNPIQIEQSISSIENIPDLESEIARGESGS